MTRTVSPSPEIRQWLLNLPACHPPADGWTDNDRSQLQAIADALESTQAEIARLTTALHEVRDVAERLSVEAQIAAPTRSECRLRSKMGSCASDLFAALKDSFKQDDIARA
jgi:hypothetical protein